MEQARHTLYVFVEGADLEAVATRLDSEFQSFVSSGEFRWCRPVAVNRKFGRTPEMRSEDLPQWELGVTMDLPEPGHEPKGWFADVERTVLLAARLHAETGRDFVVGILDVKRGISEDLFTVESENPDLNELRAIIGVGNAS